MLLPTLDPRVPTALRSRSRQRVAAQAAQLLLDGGVIHRRDLGAAGDEPLVVAERALNRWLQQALGAPLQLLSCQFMVDVEDDHGNIECLSVYWFVGCAREIFLGPPLEALEHAAPGLGANVLDVLQRQFVCPLYTPVDALDHAVSAIWMGEDDEAAMLEHACAAGGNREELLAQIVTRRMFDDAFPAWVLQDLDNHGLPARALAQVARGRGWHAQVAQAARRARAAVLAARRAMRVVRNLFDEEEGEFTGWAAVLRWNAGDNVTERVADDQKQFVSSYGARDAVAAASLDPQHPVQIRRFLHALRIHCRAMRALDDLVVLLADGQ